MKLTIIAIVAFSAISFAETTPELCQVIQNGRATGVMISKTQGDGFYNQASQLAQKSGQCVKANLLGSYSSVRIYQGGTGKRLSGKGDSEFSGQSQQANYTCIEMTCNPVVDSKAQTDNGYGTGEIIHPGASVSTPSNPYPSTYPSDASY